MRLLSEFDSGIKDIAQSLAKESNSENRALSVAIDRNSCTQRQFDCLKNSFTINALDISPVSQLRVVKS